MKRFNTFVFLAAIIFFGAIYFDPKLHQQFVSHLYFSYCDSPIHYRVDNVDPRFGISKQVFETDVSQATKIWDQAEGKDLFVYDPRGDLSINLTFDQRQALNNQINQIQNQLNNQQSTLKPELAQYQQESAGFDAKVQAFKSEVDYWNSQGGAPPDEYQKLQQEQADLKAEADRLDQMAKDLNLSASQYNANVDKYNQTVGEFNQALQLKPEEGLYDGPNDRIDIYFDNSQSELIHTLAHELGHALGMDHNPNPRSIMYAYSTKYTAPTANDLASLQEVCKTHSIFEGVVNKVHQLLNRQQ